jgi:hypothetical protein
MKRYSYRHVVVGRPDWDPLQRAALRTLDRFDVPSISAGEFMWMGRLNPVAGGAPLHLYKHIHTRRYLNIDTDLRYYAYIDDRHEIDQPLLERVAHYRRLRGIASAIGRLRLDRCGHVADVLPADLPPNVVPFDRSRRHGGSVA